jgi:hypothetical protein
MMQNADDAFKTVRAMLAAGRHEDARVVLWALTVKVPAFEAAWLQLLAMEPSLAQEIELLEGFLLHHPHHRFAEAFRSRLRERQIVMVLSEAKAVISEPVTEEAPVSMRLGEFLIKQNWVTPEQIEHALKEQQLLRDSGVEQRLGTILLMQGHLQLDQLAVALGAASANGFGELGDYLVRTHVLTRDQVAMALARQAELRAHYDRRYLEELATYHKSRGLLGRVVNNGPPARKPVPRLGEVVVDMGLLTQDQVEAVLQERQKTFNALFY